MVTLGKGIWSGLKKARRKAYGALPKRLRRTSEAVAAPATFGMPQQIYRGYKEATREYAKPPTAMTQEELTEAGGAIIERARKSVGTSLEMYAPKGMQTSVSKNPRGKNVYDIFVPLAKDTPSGGRYTLTQEQYNQFTNLAMGRGAGGADTDPKVKEILEWRAEQQAQNLMAKGEYKTALEARAAVRKELETGEFIMPELTTPPGYDILTATLAEAALPAISEGITWGAGAKLLAGAASKVSPWAAVAVGGGKALNVFGGSYIANHKEDVSNLKRSSMETKSGIRAVPTMMNRPGGPGPIQSQLDMLGGVAQLDYEIALAYEKRDNIVTGNVADADQLIAGLESFKARIVPASQQQINRATADPNYKPEMLIIFDEEGNQI